MKKTGFGMLLIALVLFGTSACSEYSNKLKGDLDGDGHLGRGDIDLMTNLIAQGSSDSDADLNNDGKVDQGDMEELKDLVCQANGANTNSDGECCVTSNDGTVCCDVNYDGDFNECHQDTTCETDQDCDILNCPAYCTSEGKCRCENMCDSDEDCIALNCPAFCNDNGACECKVTCEADLDCAFISKCQSVCGNQGYCECPEECIGEGEGFTGDPNQSECCEGLAPIEWAEYHSGECMFVDCLCYVCADCGDDLCGPGENPCNCPADCGECVPGDTRPHHCQAGNQQVTWCTCTDEKVWDCVGNPEELCIGDCHKVGEHFLDYEGTEQCCEGLTKADDCTPMVYNNEIVCECFDCPCFVCVECGDDICAEGENHCTCPEDCPLPECTEGATLPCGCQNNYEEEPPCWECDGEGHWYPIEYAADPCNCNHWTGCREGFVCEGDGRCVPDCRLVNCDPGSNCDICGEFSACHPDTGLCVPDCRYLDFACPQGETCDEEIGICVPRCLGEGEKFEDFDTAGKCCEGLVAVPDHFPENGQCIGPNCPCFVCTRCGTDEGVCSQGENRCNCPEDCVGAGGCTADQCEDVGTPHGPYAVSGDCPGIPEPDLEMYAIIQEGCTLAFQGLLEDLLGPTGCIDHHVIFTGRRCTGFATITGVSRTMYFTCPFPNAEGNQDTCRVFLDDMID